MEESILQFIGNYGVLGLLCYLAIKEFFSWLGKKNGNGNGDSTKIDDDNVLETKTQEVKHNIPALKKRKEFLQEEIDRIDLILAGAEKVGVIINKPA